MSSITKVLVLLATLAALPYVAAQADTLADTRIAAIAQTFQITEAQARSMANILMEAHADRVSLQSGGGNPEQMETALRKIRKKADARILEVLGTEKYEAYRTGAPRN